ncbi:MAG: hypothetical protein P8X95_27845, partial [Anaerolineales bacterium]
CDQVEDPKAAKGLVKREVVRVVTPGMIIEDELLDAKANIHQSNKQGWNALMFAAMDGRQDIVRRLKLFNPSYEKWLISFITTPNLFV